MKYFILIINLFVLALTSTHCTSTTKNYKIKFGTFKIEKSNSNYLVLRSFNKDNSLMYFCVNPETLETLILRDSEGKYNSLSWEEVKNQYKNTPYIRAIISSSKMASQLQDAGISHALPSERGINLTIDLCPSRKRLDRTIFTTIIDEFNKIETPTPMAISVSGNWLNNHKQDLEWIKKLIDDKKIKVDWINHSYSHKYGKDLPLKENFLLEKGTDVNYEILQNEITMIDNGLMPSVMFRFPGLVSDKTIFDKVTDYGLIPIGTDAWLSKNQKAKNGSIVLIHGNGNEPIGVDDFIQLIKSEKRNIKNKDWLLFDLRESIETENK